MSVIKTHDITLYGKTGEYDIVLRPLCDEHLPLLYKWNADPEVLYWTEGDDIESHGEESVRGIYGYVSKNALCFLMEVNGAPIGECWLQKMNIPEVSAMYPGQDVRRIDMMIGEKNYWSKGIGTAAFRMLVDLAFRDENADVIHGLIYNHNARSLKLCVKNGFTEVMRKPTQDSARHTEEIHLALTREQFIASGGNNA